MATHNPNNYPTEDGPVYTIYTGVPINVNYGFQQSQSQAPPPKYEDVISGKAYQTPPPPQPHTNVYPQELESGGVIYITPVKYSKTQRLLGSIFMIIFLIAFISILIKILGR